ncbi:actin-binding Rho-activating protein-like isoform X1 [Ischnura elegans]|uniref:actin-binding Rho-activating protein-like isoform X1 n=1 Tax=Ischnura elegans TaxID=197161 RepID=UPI001ED8A278|nr:actin-binding Rho-activating protein-like isoform X1 [Ischnura elegans]
MEKDAVADLLKQPLDKRYCHGLTDKVKMFQNKAETHQQSQEKNPFSAQWLQKDRKGVGANYAPKKGDPEYGRPPSGSKTEFRGLKAHSHVTKEMLELCEIIHENAEYSDGELDGISFGELFKIYTNISNKVVGILLRGRKHQFLHFEGETLFQRRDDDKIIFLLKPIAEIREIFHSHKEDE